MEEYKKQWFAILLRKNQVKILFLPTVLCYNIKIEYIYAYILRNGELVHEKLI